MNTEHIETIKSIIESVLGAMGLHATVQHEETITKGWVFNIQLGNESYLLIGHRGAHLHALEILVQAMVARKFAGQFVRFSLDVDDYRQKREWYIKETVKAAVAHIERTGRGTALVPMPNYERKLVHSYLQTNFPEAVSTSSGHEPHRRVVIRIKKQESGIM